MPSYPNSVFKRLTGLLFVMALTGLAAANANAQSTGPTTTDDVVSSISGIKRPAPKSTPASNGPKKGLEGTLTNDPKGESPMAAFSSTTPKIYLRWNEDSGAKGEAIRVVWYLEAKNKKLTEGTETLPGPSANGQFFLSEPSGGFPVGKYRVNLYEGPKLSKSMTFTVTK